MPNMQRLTDTGICMHSGNLPGYPASHGCIRMPFDFSQLLFSVTATGGTVVVGDGKVPVPHLASNPGLLLAPKDFTSEMLRPLAQNEYDWNPERSESGPITMVVSAADKAIYVYRNGKPIGRAPVEISGRGSLGNHVFSLLEGTTGRQSSLVPGRDARRWMGVTSSGRSVDAEQIASRLRINPEFAGKVYDTYAGHDCHHHGPAGRAEPRQRCSLRRLRACRRADATRAGALSRPRQQHSRHGGRPSKTQHRGRVLQYVGTILQYY